jgi:hypothetical protein
MGDRANRMVFALGTAVGATIGVGAAMRATGLVQRSARDELQQSLEAVLFRLLDMRPFAPVPVDIVTDERPALSPSPYTAPVDVVLGSRPGQPETGVHT